MESRIMNFLFSISLILIALTSVGQDTLYGLAAYNYPDFRNMDTSLRSTYPFVKYEVNNYQFYSEESKSFRIFYDKLTGIIENKSGKLNIYHIGGSHLQADIYTHDVRAYLQSKWTGITCERGWVFPFDLAQTNSGFLRFSILVQSLY